MQPSLFVESGTVKLAVYRWDSVPGRETLVLVHGYPDCAQVWQATAQILSARYNVVAYDVRGAGLSGVPRRVRDYALTQLVADLRAVLDAVSPQQPVHLLCHDWGSIQCWEAVTTPEMQPRIASFTSISGPGLDHAAHWMRAALREGGRARRAVFRQLRRSWYMFLFQLPLLSPLSWKLGLWRRWPQMLRQFDGIDMEDFSPTRRGDGANGMNLYRANMLPRLLRPRECHTTVPVQLLVPTQDPFVQKQLLDSLARWVPRLWRRELDAGHWIPLSHPQWIAQATAGFVDFVGNGASGVREARTGT